MNANKTNKQPNIVLIITDQQRYDTIAALGYPFMETPNLDRLAREGTTFTNCFIPATSCVPARCSLFTGYYPHNSGVYKNGDHWTRGWVEDLAEAGYHCVNMGKMHTVPFTTPFGFHERYVVENKDRFLEGRYFFDEWDKALAARGLIKQQRELYRKRSDYRDRMGAFTWDLDPDMQSDAFVGGMTRWWLSGRPQTQPLFLQIGFPGPHPPYDPVPKWADRYMEKDIPLAAVSEEDIAFQPAALKELREHMFRVDHDSVFHLCEPTEAQRKLQRAYYLANVSMIDEEIGKIIEVLGSEGYLDNSVIIFTSDHGDCLGDHGHIQKWNMYEQVVRAPAIFWASEGVRKNFDLYSGTVDALYQVMDFGPTILELAGLTPAADIDAVSMLPALRKQAGGGLPESGTPGHDEQKPVAESNSEWDTMPAPPVFAGPEGREYVFAEHGRDNIFTGAENIIMVRSARWKLVYFSDSSEGQLFSLDDDPEENINLWDDPGCREKKEELLGVLRDWMVRSSYRSRRRRRK